MPTRISASSRCRADRLSTKCRRGDQPHRARRRYGAPHLYRPRSPKNILTQIETGELEQPGIKEADYDPTVWKFSQSLPGQDQYTVPSTSTPTQWCTTREMLATTGLPVPTTLDEWQDVNNGRPAPASSAITPLRSATARRSL